MDAPDRSAAFAAHAHCAAVTPPNSPGSESWNPVGFWNHRLKDKYHRPHEPEITDEAKAWVVSLACTKPKDHGLAAELWSISALARFVCEAAKAAGFARLANAGKSTVWRILDDNDIKPHKIRYYLEKRDPEFDRQVVVQFESWKVTVSAMLTMSSIVQRMVVTPAAMAGVVLTEP